MARYIAEHYNLVGTLTTIDNARADAVEISKRIHGGMVYVNENKLGNPYGVVYQDGKYWYWESRRQYGRYIINPKTGEIIRKE